DRDAIYRCIAACARRGVGCRCLSRLACRTRADRGRYSRGVRGAMLRRWLGALVLALTGVARAAGPLPDVESFGDGSHGRGFAQVLAPRAFEFPRDHGPHPDYRQEWWYVTGNLDGPNGERFGFELTFFRFALAPPPVDSIGEVMTPAPSNAGAVNGSASDPAPAESAW